MPVPQRRCGDLAANNHFKNYSARVQKRDECQHDCKREYGFVDLRKRGCFEIWIIAHSRDLAAEIAGHNELFLAWRHVAKEQHKS